MEINTKEYANLWKKELKESIIELNSKPTLVIIIAEDFYKPSSIYVANKRRLATELGIETKLIKIQGWENKTKDDLLTEIREIIDSHEGCSIICQLPFPQLTENEIAELIPVKFDVDGFTNYQKGLLVSGSKKALVPCTALGVIKLLKYIHGDLTGKSIAIVSRSNLIGKPLIQLALQNNMTPTIVHTKTYEEEMLNTLQSKSIIVTGCGQRKIFNCGQFHFGYVQTIIDCSMDKVDGIAGVGDCDKEDILENLPHINIASGYGHTGIMTVLGLCDNVIKAHKLFLNSDTENMKQ